MCLTCGDYGSPGDPPTDPPATSSPTVTPGSPTQVPTPPTTAAPTDVEIAAPTVAPSKGGGDGGPPPTPEIGFFSLTAALKVKENDAIGTVVFDVGAAYTGPNNVAFVMVEGSGARARRAGDELPFVIDPVTGVIAVSGELDFETQPTYGITISANGPSGVVASASTAIDVEGVACPDGLTSTTGTYPCQSIAAAQDQAEDDGGGSNNAAVAGGVSVGLLCLLLLLFLLGGFLFRHRRDHLMDEKEYATSSDVENPLRANPMAAAHSTLSAQQVWNIDGFHRVAVFDKFYYDNEFLMSSDEQFLDVFRDLQLIAPGPQSMAAYRKDTAMFLDKQVQKGDNLLMMEAVDFLGKAWPDILIEFMIDRIAMEQLGKGYEDMLFTDYMCPNDNPFLERRHDLNRPLVSPLGGEALYSFSSSDAGAIYSQAGGHASEYAVANGSDATADSDLYAMASSGASGEDLYQMASGNDGPRDADTDDIYTIASHGDEQTYQMAGALVKPRTNGGDGGNDDNIYTVASGSTDDDRVYDNTGVGHSHGVVFNLLDEGTEAIYSAASSSDVVLTLQESDDRTYDTGTDDTCDNPMPSERTYDTGSDETSGVTETCIDMSPAYDVGTAQTHTDSNIILPVVYDSGATDGCVHEEPSITFEKSTQIVEDSHSTGSGSPSASMHSLLQFEEDDTGSGSGVGGSDDDGYLQNDGYQTTKSNLALEKDVGYVHGKSVTPLFATEDDDMPSITKDGYVECEGAQTAELVREDSFVEISNGGSRLKSVVRKNPLFAVTDTIKDESV